MYNYDIVHIFIDDLHYVSVWLDGSYNYYPSQEQVVETGMKAALRTSYRKESYSEMDV